MARSFNATRALVWELDEVLTGLPFSYGGQTYITEIVDGSVTWMRYISQIGNGAASFYAFDNWEQFLVPGRILVVEKPGYYQDFQQALAGRLLACFLIDEIEPTTNGGISIINVRGQGVEALLTKQAVWSPIGELQANYTELDVAVSGPSARTLAVGVPEGNETVILNTTNSDDERQEIRITLNNGGTHVSTITERKFYNDQWYLVLADRLPSAADSGNAVSIRARRIRVKNVTGFIPNAEVVVAYGGNTLYTTVDPAVAIEDANRVTLVDGFSFAVPADTQVINSNRFSPATDDVTQILAHAADWTAVFQTGNGTAVGTSHIPHGESVFEMLSSVAERTAEFFRYRIETNTNFPTYKIEWRRTADSSGVTLILYDSDEYARQATDEMSGTKGAAFSIRRRRALPLVTKIYPTGGDQSVSLAAASSDARTFATANGCAVNTGSGLYEPDFVTHTAGVAAYGIHELNQTYGDISVTDARSQAAIVAASDQLLISAVQTLVTAQAREYYTIDAYVPVNLQPGQTVKIDNATRVEPTVSSSSNWIILDVTERLVDGRPRTTINVSNMLGQRWTPANQFAARMKSIIQSQRRASAGGAVMATSSSASGTPGITDHGLLTGLGDDDHTQYLLASGARPLAANLSVNAGVTIDGVDISAHAANANAHHAAVTALDTSIAISGQAIRVADAFAGSGLALGGGILAVNTATAQGTAISGDTVAVAPSSTGGLQNTSGGVGIKTPANSGLNIDGNGAALGAPLPVSSTSLNAVTGAGHSHAVTTTDNAKATPATILRGGASGDVTLRNLTADRLIAPILETLSGGLRLDPASGVTTNDGDLSFIGARSILTDTGSLTLSPAATLVLSPDDNVAQIGPTTTLKTAHWVSGFLGAGWGVTYDGNGDFRTLYADELHVAAFIADTARVAVGAEYVTPGMALIARNFTIPAVNGTGLLYVEDAPGLSELPVFADNDWVLLRIMDRDGGGLLVANVWGQVTAYTDRADGEQSWTFTTRSTTAAGEVARIGALALDFGKSGDGWWWVTTLDQAGSPYAGITTWSGANPYDEGNRVHRLRLGQLRGVSGVNEWGLQAGTSTSSRVRFTDLRNEIHGSRLSLYAGDGGVLQVGAVDVLFYRSGTQSSTLAPDGDGTAVNVTTTAANFFSAVNEGSGSPNYGGNIANTPNMSGALFLSLSNPAAFTSIFRIDIRAGLKSLNISNDTIRIYGQVFQSDEATPLTGEVLLATRTANSTATVTTTAPHEGYATATQAEWNGARLRLRWEYEINANEEAIRLDPGVPSLAVGNPLPTAPQTGGDGFWVGAIDGGYALRIGGALGSAPQLLYNGASGRLALRQADGTEAVVFDAGGAGYFAAAVTIGAAGGIWQGTGSFASPTTGLKIYNSGGVGRLSTYNAGLEQITINTAGQLVAGQGKLLLDREGLSLSTISTYQAASAIKFLDAAGRVYGKLYGYDAAFNDSIDLAVTSPDGTNSLISLTSANGNAITRLVAGTASISLSMALSGYTSLDMTGISELTARDTGVIAKSLLLGETSGGVPPLTGVLVMKERTAATSTTPTGAAQIWVQVVGGVQKFYIKFANGVQRELATA